MDGTVFDGAAHLCVLRSHLAPPESQPLYEVCYYSSSAVLRRHLNATPRTSIQTALSNPYHYLKVNSYH